MNIETPAPQPKRIDIPPLGTEEEIQERWDEHYEKFSGRLDGIDRRSDTSLKQDIEDLGVPEGLTPSMVATLRARDGIIGENVEEADLKIIYHTSQSLSTMLRDFRRGVEENQIPLDAQRNGEEPPKDAEGKPIEPSERFEISHQGDVIFSSKDDYYSFLMLRNLERYMNETLSLAQRFSLTEEGTKNVAEILAHEDPSDPATYLGEDNATLIKLMEQTDPEDIRRMLEGENADDEMEKLAWTALQVYGAAVVAVNLVGGVGSYLQDGEINQAAAVLAGGGVVGIMAAQEIKKAPAHERLEMAYQEFAERHARYIHENDSERRIFVEIFQSEEGRESLEAVLEDNRAKGEGTELSVEQLREIHQEATEASEPEENPLYAGLYTGARYNASRGRLYSSFLADPEEVRSPLLRRLQQLGNPQ